MTERTGRIDVRNLTKTFGAVTAVDDVSFTVEPGAITGFLGPNGAGKTTTLRMILGLITADSGRVTIGGRRYADLPRPSDEVGAALEATGFHPARSGRNHLRVYCTINGYPPSRADQVLEQVGLTGAASRAVGGYSLGMRQRLALAAALLGDPQILVLDEPANGLDPQGISWMRRFLKNMAAHGRTILISSHVLSEVRQLVDRVIILDRGRIVGQGPLADMAQARSATTVRSPHADDLVRVLDGGPGNVPHIERGGPEELTIIGMDSAQIGHIAHRAHIELHELTPARDDLEHLFLTLTSQEPNRHAQSDRR